MTQLKRTRPCDACKLRKRKCDGKLPCSTCVRSRAGPSQCTYSQKQKRDYDGDDPILEKLRYFESVLATIAPQFIQSDLKLDHLKTIEAQDSFLKHEENMLQPPMKDIDGFYLKEDPNSLDRASGSQIDSYLDFNTFTNSMGISLDTYGADIGMFEAAFQSSLDPYYSALAIPPNSLIPVLDSDVNEHLEGLSFLFYCGYSPLSDFSCSIPLHRPQKLSESLKQEISYHSCFYSAHPSLFTKKPTMKERLRVAENFVPDIVKDLYSSQPTDNITICDNIRALILHAITQYAIGNGMESTELIGIIYPNRSQGGLFG
jgi:hypothetical protein